MAEPISGSIILVTVVAPIAVPIAYELGKAGVIVVWDNREGIRQVATNSGESLWSSFKNTTYDIGSFIRNIPSNIYSNTQKLTESGKKSILENVYKLTKGKEAYLKMIAENAWKQKIQKIADLVLTNARSVDEIENKIIDKINSLINDGKIALDDVSDINKLVQILENNAIKYIVKFNMEDKTEANAHLNSLNGESEITGGFTNQCECCFTGGCDDCLKDELTTGGYTKESLLENIKKPETVILILIAIFLIAVVALVINCNSSCFNFIAILAGLALIVYTLKKDNNNNIIV